MCSGRRKASKEGGGGLKISDSDSSRGHSETRKKVGRALEENRIEKWTK